MLSHISATLCTTQQLDTLGGGGGEGGTPIFFLYGDVPMDRVWYSEIPILNRVYNLPICDLNGVFDFRANPLEWGCMSPQP